MREIVLRSAAAFDDTPPPEFVERVGKTAFVPIGNFLKQFEAKGPPCTLAWPGRSLPGSRVRAVSRIRGAPVRLSPRHPRALAEVPGRSPTAAAPPENE